MKDKEIKPKTVNTLEEIKKLPLGTTLYRPTATDVRWYYYYGINPKSPGSIMLGSDGSVQKIHGEYIGDDIREPYYLDYKEACIVACQMAADNAVQMKRIFLKES